MPFWDLFSFVFAKIAVGFALIFLPHIASFPPSAAPTTARIASTTTPKTEASVATPAPVEQKIKTAPVSAPAKTETPTPPAPQPQQKPASTSNETGADLNARVRASIVNILCTGSGGPLHPASGSGVIIDPSGIILTNAHLGQFFLLKDYPTRNTITCVIRTDSPARTMYTAELLYISTQWVKDNAYKIALQNPTGTGENDYALLRITGRSDPSASLPATFPYIELDTKTEPDIGDGVLLAGYPAGFLDGATIQINLYMSSAFTTVQALYNFIEGDPVGLVSIAGTVVSQHGSSGGAVVRTDSGKLQGIIVTATEADTTAARDLRAITLNHIDRSIATETGGGLAAFLSGDLAAKAASFRITTAPSLARLLIDELEK